MVSVISNLQEPNSACSKKENTTITTQAPPSMNPNINHHKMNALKSAIKNRQLKKNMGSHKMSHH
jgi:hypothetical protein